MAGVMTWEITADLSTSTVVITLQPNQTSVKVDFTPNNPILDQSDLAQMFRLWGEIQEVLRIIKNS